MTLNGPQSAETYFFVDTIMCDSCRANISIQLSKIIGIIGIEYPFVKVDTIQNGGQYVKVTHYPDQAPAENIEAEINTIKAPNWTPYIAKFHHAVVTSCPSPRQQQRYGY